MASFQLHRYGSERFTKHSVQESKGSTNPYINFPDIAKFEFYLPPLDQQRRIAEILWAVDETAEAHVSTLQSCEQAYATAINHLLFNQENNAKRVGALSRINADKLSDSETDPQFTFSYVDIGSVIAPKKLGSLATYTFAGAPSRARRVVSSGDILISTVRPNLKAFVRVDRHDGPLVASTGFAVITPENKTVGDLLFHSFFSSQFMAHCDCRVTGTSYPAMNARDVSDFIVFIPEDKNEQVEAANLLKQLEAATNHIRSHIENSYVLQKQILEDLLKALN